MFESCKICLAGNHCDNSDFDFHNAEHKELPVIKISPDEVREDCQQVKPNGTQASLGTSVIAVIILLILSILFRRVTVNVPVRIKGGMSLRNSMWHGLRNDIIMRNVKYGKWHKEIN